MEDCPYCGKCPVCGQQNNHIYHKRKPWNLFSCHPFYEGKEYKENTEPVKSGIEEYNELLEEMDKE